MTLERRRCDLTGLQLISDPGADGFHVAKTQYPPLSAAPRSNDGGLRLDWNRYDVLGETYYVAETRECAYAEVLSPFKRANGTSDPLADDAAFFGMSLEEFVEEVSRDWSERDFMGLGAIPAGWRYDRGMYTVGLQASGWLVDIEHPDSISALEGLMGTELGALGVKSLTTGTLRGEDRTVTTAIAMRLHDTALDDGDRPIGIHFGSKHGAAWCRAFWLDKLGPGDLLPLSPDEIRVTDDALRKSADRFRIRVF